MNNHAPATFPFEDLRGGAAPRFKPGDTVFIVSRHGNLERRTVVSVHAVCYAYELEAPVRYGKQWEIGTAKGFVDDQSGYSVTLAPERALKAIEDDIRLTREIADAAAPPPKIPAEDENGRSFDTELPGL
jgi:hypothetical protein